MKNREMLRVLWLGRGGQGAVTASNILVSAFVTEGLSGFSMPEFGVERRGAPVRAYSIVAMNKEKELPREPIREVDVIIIMEKSLINRALRDVLLGKNTIFIINTTNVTETLNDEILSNYEVWIVNATKISLEIFGRPLVNMVLLGAFSRVIDSPKLDSLITAVRKEFGEGGLEPNIKAMKRGFDEVKRTISIISREEAMLHEIA